MVQLGHLRCCPIKLSIGTPNYLHLKPPPTPCSNLVTNFPSGFTFCQLGTEGVLKCSKPSKLAEEIWVILEHPTPVHVITRLCPRRGLGLAWTRLLGFQQSAIEAPSTQAFCFAYPAFPIKRKSRKLNPKLPARYPNATRSKPTVYKS